MLLWLPGLILAQAKELSDPEPYFSALITSDIEASIRWYCDHLGFEVLNRVESEERKFKQANLQRGQCLIELIELQTMLRPEDLLATQEKGTRIAGFYKFGFTVTDFDQWVEYLTASGVEFHGRVVGNPLSGKKMVIVKDPDGNRIQLFER